MLLAITALTRGRGPGHACSPRLGQEVLIARIRLEFIEDMPLIEGVASGADI
jgi:hypothetical protein